MNTIKIESKNVKMIAHRGVSSLERENTNAAFVAAGNRSYFGIETDIQVIADGTFIALHDDTTDRVCLGKCCVNAKHSSFDDIKNIVLPDIDGSFNRADLHIPTLDDYIKICKKYDKICILEVKNVFAFNDLVRMVDRIKQLDYIENVIFISIEYENCVNLRKLLPEAKIQYLTGQRMDDEVIEMLTSIGIDAGIDIDYNNHQRDKERIDLLHSKGIEVNVCVCDDPALAREIIDMGADYLTTNCLE